MRGRQCDPTSSHILAFGLALGYVRAVPAPNRVTRCSAYAWGAFGAVATFIALTCWWLTQDRSVPIYDAGYHLNAVAEYHSMIASGNLLGPFTQESAYPTLGALVGVLGMLVGGVSVASPIVADNLVFVPLLALGCYQTGRLLFGRLAGMLAVILVLCSPMVISLFHVYMLDPPLTALVAVSIWLILASEDFSRTGVAAAAGLAVGLGLNVKAQFPLYVAGLTLVVLLHGGWRNWRGFASFCVVALAVGTPWYLLHFSELGILLELGGTASGAAPGNTPPTFSTDNLLWYFWNSLNSQLLGPFFMLAAGGTLWTLVALVRDRGERGARLEFFAGGFTAWLAITLTPHHDIRYGLPLLAFASVIATGWIVTLPRIARVAAIGLLALGAAANTLGIDFGVGREVAIALTHPLPVTEQRPNRLTLFSTTGFLTSAPSRDGDVPGLLAGLYREGVRTLAVSLDQTGGGDFSFYGVASLARIAKLSPAVTDQPEVARTASTATIFHEAATAHAASPCTWLSDGTGVWVVRYDTTARKLAFYCPARRPQFYEPGVVIDTGG